jgi:ribonuclease HI
MTEWIAGWQKKGWRNSKKEPVVNRDLWELLLAVTKPHSVQWKWVRGHNGHVENERCDQLARDGIPT